jgi:hypothetical protein
LMLAMFDVGNLIGQPSMGGLIELARHLGLPPYGILFTAVSLTLVVVGGIYCWFSDSVSTRGQYRVRGRTRP